MQQSFNPQREREETKTETWVTLTGYLRRLTHAHETICSSIGIGAQRSKANLFKFERQTTQSNHGIDFFRSTRGNEGKYCRCCQVSSVNGWSRTTKERDTKKNETNDFSFISFRFQRFRYALRFCSWCVHLSQAFSRTELRSRWALLSKEVIVLKFLLFHLFLLLHFYVVAFFLFVFVRSVLLCGFRRPPWIDCTKSKGIRGTRPFINTASAALIILSLALEVFNRRFPIEQERKEYLSAESRKENDKRKK